MSCTDFKVNFTVPCSYLPGLFHCPPLLFWFISQGLAQISEFISLCLAHIVLVISLCLAQILLVNFTVPYIHSTGYFTIFTFNKHFDKENDCVHEPVITQPHHWRRLFITFYIMNFLLFINENSTYLMKYIVTCVAK